MVHIHTLLVRKVVGEHRTICPTHIQGPYKQQPYILRICACLHAPDKKVRAEQRVHVCVVPSVASYVARAAAVVELN